MAGLDWLTARPVAHRGLHDAARGVVENTASAFSAAVTAQYAIECDLQIADDGEAMVFHDDTLDRLTDQRGPLARRSSRELQAIALRDTGDRIITLSELCTLAAGRVPLILELKSRFDGDTRLAGRVADVLQSYAGPVAAMSFDPDFVTAIAAAASGLPRGLVAGNGSRIESGSEKIRYLRTALRSRPHFLAWSVRDLPAAVPLTTRYLFGMPLLTWTVRTDSERTRARRWADQIIFEGFRP